MAAMTASGAHKNPSIPDIRDIPRLQAGLPPGTIAWATVDQLHPTQPQTGKREVNRKIEKVKKFLKAKGEKFSQELYEFEYEKAISPIYVANTPRSDSRSSQEPVLGYMTDRTHGSNAISEMFKKVYGKPGLKQPIYDLQGRPLNFILVRVLADHTEMSENQFNQFMVDHQYCYLKNWVRGKKGITEIQSILFADLPERVTETTDNPFRGLIGDLQHQGRLGRSDYNFSQFIAAEALVKKNIIQWDEVSLSASDKIYEKALKKASDFFQEEDRGSGEIPSIEPLKEKLRILVPSCSRLMI